jgi:citrate lyase beta subunit
MNKIDYIELGATLFVPAIHKDLEQIVSGKKYPNLKSVLIDTEDAITEEQLPSAMQNIKNLLNSLEKSSCLVFVRPRNIKVLKEILKLTNVEQIDGFILPKFSLDNAKDYLRTLKFFPHAIMPSIETKELFNQKKLIKLSNILLSHKDKVVLVRFGLEDMLRQLSMKRECEQSLFDISVTASVLGNFIAIFKSAGFAVSGGVYPCFRDDKGFKKDIKRDLKEGLFSKTIIHPNQIDIANKTYMVTLKEFDEACEIYESKEAVFNQNGKMAESLTMFPHAKEIMQRASVYGIKA